MEEVQKLGKDKINNKCKDCKRALISLRRKNYYIIVDENKVLCEEKKCYNCKSTQYVPIVFSDMKGAEENRVIIACFGLKTVEQFLDKKLFEIEK